MFGENILELSDISVMAIFADYSKCCSLEKKAPNLRTY